MVPRAVAIASRGILARQRTSRSFRFDEWLRSRVRPPASASSDSVPEPKKAGRVRHD